MNQKELVVSPAQQPEISVKNARELPKDIQAFQKQCRETFEQLYQHILGDRPEQAAEFFDTQLKVLNKKYYTLALIYHPDKNKTGEEQFKLLNEVHDQFVKKCERLLKGETSYDDNNEEIVELLKKQNALLKELLDMLTRHNEKTRIELKNLNVQNEEIEKRLKALEDERKENLINLFSSIFESIREAFSSIGESLSSAVDQLITMRSSRTQSNQESANQQEDVSPVQMSEQLAPKNNSRPVEQSSDYGDVLKKKGEKPAKKLSCWELIKQGEIPFRVYVL